MGTGTEVLGQEKRPTYLGPGGVPLLAGGVADDGLGGVARGLVVVSAPALAPAQVEQQVEAEGGELRGQLLLLLLLRGQLLQLLPRPGHRWQPLEGVAVAVAGLGEVALPVQHVAVLQQLVQQDQSANNV